MDKKLPLKAMVLTAAIKSAYMTSVNIVGYTQQDDLLDLDIEIEGTHSPEVIRATAVSFLEDLFDERYILHYDKGVPEGDRTAIDTGHFK